MKHRNTFKKLIATLLTASAMVSSSATLSAAELQPKDFKVLGTWNSLTQYINYEEPFWTKTLPDASEGKVGGEIISISVMGLKGYETLNLLKNGVFDVGNMVVAYVTQSVPEMEGIDLAGVATDMAASRRNADAYRDTINQYLAEENLQMLAVYPFGRQYVFCRDPLTGLTDLKGRKIRTSSATHADFLTGTGAVNVTIPFGEVIPAIQKGVVDCAVTGALPAYDAKWAEVISHMYSMPLNMGLAAMYTNKANWDKLDAGTREFLSEQITAWEDATWKGMTQEDEEGVACLTGDKTNCSKNTYDMTLVQVADGDLKQRDDILQKHVFTEWLKRCGDDCKAVWNGTIGNTADITIQ